MGNNTEKWRKKSHAEKLETTVAATKAAGLAAGAAGEGLNLVCCEYYSRRELISAMCFIILEKNLVR
jgi:hypothetical protein